MGRYERFIDKERLFEAYSADRHSSGAQAADHIALFELGQRWDYLITLRLPRDRSDRLLLDAVRQWLLLLERSIHQHAASERLRCSVYLHSDAGTFHAHIYLKTPLCHRNEKASWESRMVTCWYLLEDMEGHDKHDLNAHFYYHARTRTSLTLAFGAYGIKGNTGYTAWIDDLGLPVYGWKRGVHEGRSLAALTDKYSVPATP